MRHLVLYRPPDGRPSYVLAETIDDVVAGNLAIGCRHAVVLSRGAAKLDPEHAGAVRAWDANDDRLAAAGRVAVAAVEHLTEAQNEGFGRRQDDVE